MTDPFQELQDMLAAVSKAIAPKWRLEGAGKEAILAGRQTNDVVQMNTTFADLQRMEGIFRRLRSEYEQSHKSRYVVTIPDNGTRFGKPWIAVVSEWPVGGRPSHPTWGNQISTLQLEVLASPGDLLRIGQPDNARFKASRKNYNQYAIALEDGSVKFVSDDEARQYWIDTHG